METIGEFLKKEWKAQKHNIPAKEWNNYQLKEYLKDCYNRTDKKVPFLKWLSMPVSKDIEKIKEGLGAQGQMIDTGDEVSIVQKAISKLPARVQSLIKPEQKYKVLSALGDTATLAVSGMKINLPTSFLNKPITWENKESLKENTMKIKKSTLKKAIHEAVLIEVTTRELEQFKGKEIAMRYKKLSTGEVKTYFGRVARTSGENVYVGCLGKGLRAFRISNIQSINPVNLKSEQIAELDEMCGTKHEDEVVNEAKKNKKIKKETQALRNRNSNKMAAARKAKKKNEACPPGFSGTVKAMKKHPEFEKECAILEKINPYALAWWMKNKGYKSHKTASGKDK
jgi:hypothetical protein